MTHPRVHRSRFFAWPATREGRRAGWLMLAAIGFSLGGMLMAGLWFGLLEEPGGDQESPPIWLQVPMLAAVLAGGVSAVVGGVFAMLALRKGDRSLVLIPAIIALLFAVTFIVGEFAVPH